MVRQFVSHIIQIVSTTLHVCMNLLASVAGYPRFVGGVAVTRDGGVESM